MDSAGWAEKVMGLSGRPRSDGRISGRTRAGVLHCQLPPLTDGLPTRLCEPRSEVDGLYKSTSVLKTPPLVKMYHNQNHCKMNFAQTADADVEAQMQISNDDPEKLPQAPSIPHTSTDNTTGHTCSDGTLNLP